jgi:hypothetical protein
MRKPSFVFLCGLAACGRSSNGMCENISTPVDLDDSSLGFSAREMYDMVTASAMPTSIVWDEATPGVESSVIAMRIDGHADEAETLGGCSGPEDTLTLPLDVSISIDDGGFSWAGQVSLEAKDLAALESIDVSSWGNPAEVSGNFEAELASHFDDHPGSEPAGAMLGLSNEWTDAKVGIWAGFNLEDGSDGAAALWMGHWQF